MTSSNKPRTARFGLRTLFLSGFQRFIRRGFFRLVLLLFLVGFVLAFSALTFFAQPKYGNALLDEVVAQVFQSGVSEVSWDREATEFNGPTLALTGSITYKDLVVKRAIGGTPHPVHGELEYELARIPEVKIFFDLKKLPDLPITRVQLSDDIQLHLNIHEGVWLDEDLFKSGDPDSESAPIALPEIVGGRATQLYMRADGILVDPAIAPKDPMVEDMWYRFQLKELSLLPHQFSKDRFQVGGKLDAGRFGTFLLGGELGRFGDTAALRVRTEKALNVNADLAAFMHENIRRTVEQFQLSLPETHVQGRISFEPGKKLNLEIDIQAINGELCFVGFPVAATNLDADIKVRNNNILVTARGRRGSGKINAVVQLENAGTDGETLSVELKVRDMLIDENLRLALLPARFQPDNVDWLTGEPVPEEDFDPRNYEKRGYTDWKGEPTWNGGLIYPDLPAILPFLCRAFTPMGITDFDMSLKETSGRFDSLTQETTSDTNMVFKVFMRDIVTSYTGLPEQNGDGFALPLHDVYGVVEGRIAPGQQDQFTVRGYTEEELQSLGYLDMTAQKGVSGTLGSEAERVFVKVVYTTPNVIHDPLLTIDISTEGLNFDEQLLTRLPEDIIPIVREFAPKGAVDIDTARIRLNPDPGEGEESELTIKFELGAKALAGQYHFKDAPEPAKFKEVAGKLVIKANEKGKVSVKLSNIRGKIDNSNVFFELDYANQEIPLYKFESDDFLVTQQLINVLSPDVGNIIKSFNVHGHVRLNIAGQMINEEPDFTNAEIEFIAGSGTRSGSIQFEAFPYELTNVHGFLFVSVRETHIEAFVRSLRGHASDVENSPEESWIEISGHMFYPLDPGSDSDSATDGETPPQDAETNYPQLDLHITGQHIAVDKKILNALDVMLRDDPEQTPAGVAFIEDLNVVGGIGLDGRITIDNENNFDWRFDIVLEGVAVTPGKFPTLIEDLFGTIVLDRTTVTLRNVTGHGESGQMSLHEAGYSEEGGWYLTAGVRNMLPQESPNMIKALPDQLKAAMYKLAPEGSFDIDLNLNGKDDILSYKVSLDIWETDIDIGLHFDDMNARFDFEGIIGDNYHRQNGSVFVESCYFKDARFDHVSSAVQLFEDRLEFPNLRGNFYDGYIEGRFGIENDGYQGQLSIRGANLKSLGLAAFPDAGDFAGVLDGEVRFHSNIDDNGTIGRGRFDVGPRNRESTNPEDTICKLAQVPLFHQIFRVVGDEQNFDEGHVYFWLMPDRIVVREMDFVSNAARVELFGSDEENFIMYDSQAMRMKLFFTIAPRSPIPLPIVQQVLDLLKQVLFPLFVTGTMNDPNVQPFSLDAEELAALQDEFPRRPRGS